MGTGGHWWGLVRTGGDWWGLVGTGGDWWGLVGAGGDWWGLVLIDPSTMSHNSVQYNAHVRRLYVLTLPYCTHIIPYNRKGQFRNLVQKLPFSCFNFAIKPKMPKM